MNSLHKKILIYEIINILIIILNISILNIYNEKIYVLYIIINLLGLKFIGFKKDKTLNKIDYIQKIFIYNFIFLAIIYLSGLVLGYLKSGYNLNIISIFKNILDKIILIILTEIIRYNLTTKTNKKYIKVLLIIVFVLFDITMTIHSYSLKNYQEILYYISLIIIPSISKNFFLTYLISKSGYKATILYRLIIELYPYILPITPDLGEYLSSIINFIYPMILFFIFYKAPIKKTNNIHKVLKFIIIFISLLIVSLVSSVFKYYLVAIGSNSMKQTISLGDAVIIKKTNQNISENDIIAYKFENRIIVHRVYKIKKINSIELYQTKGDNNDSPDNYYISNSDIIGKIVYKIPYIGIPSVWLSKIIER